MPSELALPLASDAVAVAGVHAAIVAIFMAMLVAYWGFIWGWIQPLRQRAIDRANSLEQIRITNRYMYEGLEEDYDGRNQDARSQHIANVDAITLGRPAWGIDTEEDEPNRREDPRVPPPDNPSARVHYLVATLSLMRRSYPLHGAGFGSLSEIRPWLSDALNLLQRTKKSLHFTERYVETIVGRAAKEWQDEAQKLREELRGEEREATPDAAAFEFLFEVKDPRRQFDELSGEFSDLLVEVESIGSDLDRYDDSTRRLPSWGLIAVVFTATSLAFVGGVVAPLVDTGIPRWIYVGVPCAIYVIGIASVGAYAWQELRRPRG